MTGGRSLKRAEPSVWRLWAALACCAALGGTVAAEVSSPDRPPLATLAASASAPAPVAAVWLAGPEGSALTVEQALLKAKDGDTIDLLPGEYRGGLLIENRRLVFRGVAGGKPVLIKGDGKAGTLKALWTIRGGQVTLQNLEFWGAKSAEGSGAAVRQEGGQLLIQGCQFYDNEHGLLSINDPQAQLTIESSVFGMAPKMVGGLHHLLNVGRINKLSITGSRFQQGFEGHLIKTRARENIIAYNFIHDGQRGGASYEIDIAHGGLATVLGNVIAQGSDSQNPVMVGYATEDQVWDKNVLLLAHNTFINYGWLPAWYLRVIKAHLPGEPQVKIGRAHV